MTGFTDIHCHILPGLDDGAKDRQTLRQMLLSAYEGGTRAMIATTHYNPQVFPYGAGDYEQRLMLARIEARDIGGDFAIYPGNEVFYTGGSVEAMVSGKVRPLADSFYVLVEFAPYQDFSYIYRAVQEIVRAGFRPVVAHVERYEAVAPRPEKVARLIDAGACIQVNAGHVLGSGGRRMQGCIHRLVKKGLVHMIASDGHNMERRVPSLKACAAYVREKYGERQCERLLKENPEKILKKKDIG